MISLYKCVLDILYVVLYIIYDYVIGSFVTEPTSRGHSGRAKYIQRLPAFRQTTAGVSEGLPNADL